MNFMAAPLPPPLPKSTKWVLKASGMDVLNFAGDLKRAERDEMAREVVDEYEMDRESMTPWLAAMQKGLDLAVMARTPKTTPWDNAANVKFPLVTSASLQFNARAYPAILPNGDIVFVKTHGKDPMGKKAARASRVGSWMSYQLVSVIREWEEETDKLLVTLPLAGTCFRKVWFDPIANRPRVQFCEPGRIVVNVGIRNLDEAPRISQVLELYPYEVASRKKAGLFLDEDLGEESAVVEKTGPEGKTTADSRDPKRPYVFIEQHRWMDLDDDGVDEPYIVTVHRASQKLVRIVADYTPDDVVMSGDEIVKVERRSHFVAYHFLPDPTGKFLGMGFGLLLGDISESIDTTINMLFNSGHLSSLGAGFIGAEFRVKGGPVRFRPGEYKQVQTAGQDIRAAVVPLQLPEPSKVLYDLLGMLIESGREIASVKDVMTGEASRQMTATTTLALIEQGQMLFTAAYKRVWRALREEFRLLAGINARHLDPGEYARFHDIEGEAPDPKADFDLADMDIVPVADPRSVTSPQKMAKAGMLQEMAQAGMVNPVTAGQRMLEAAGHEDIEELMPPPPDPQAAEFERIMRELALQKALVEIDGMRAGAVLDIAKAEGVEQGNQTRLYATFLQEHSKLLQERIRGAFGGESERLAGKSGDGVDSGPPDPGRGIAEAERAGESLDERLLGPGSPLRGPGPGAIGPGPAVGPAGPAGLV